MPLPIQLIYIYRVQRYSHPEATLSQTALYLYNLSFRVVHPLKFSLSTSCDNLTLNILSTGYDSTIQK